MKDMITLNAVNTNTEFLTDDELNGIAEELGIGLVVLSTEVTGEIGNRVKRHSFKYITDFVHISFGQLARIADKYGISTTNLTVASTSTGGTSVDIVEYECTIIGNRGRAAAIK